MAQARLDAVVLAGGLGTRLRPVVSDRPKPMASMDGVPFLDILLHQLARSGMVRSAVLAVGYKAEFVRDFYASGERFGLPIGIAVETEPLGTAGGLLNALPLTASEDVLVLNGDSFVEADIGLLIETHRRRNANATLALSRTTTPERYGTVECGADGEVLQFREKTAAAAIPAYINAGIYLFRRAILEQAPARRPLSIEIDIFPTLPSGTIRSVVAQGRFIDIGLPESYAASQHLLRDLITAAGRNY